MRQVFRFNVAAVVFTLIIGVAPSSCNLNAADWPRLRGNGGLASSPDELRTAWPTNGLPIAWSLNTPDGYSSAAIVQGRLFTLAGRSLSGLEGREVCVALDAMCGKELWRQLLGTVRRPYYPLSTPTFWEGRVYVYGVGLSLYCLESGTGDVVWWRDLKRDFAQGENSYGNSQSPWVEDGRVFVSVVAATNGLLCFNATNGALIWRGHSNSPSYASPIGTTIHGVRQIVFPDSRGLVSVSPDTGGLLWRFEYVASSAQGACPVFLDDIGVFFSSHCGAAAFRINYTNASFSTTALWTYRLSDSYSTGVFLNGHFYANFRYNLSCLEPATGKVKWDAPELEAKSVSLVKGHLLILSDSGDVSLVKASPEGYEEVARTETRVATGLWGNFLNSPAIWNGRIYIRDPKRLICYDASVTSPLRVAATLGLEPKQMCLSVARSDGSPLTNGPTTRVYLRWSPDLEAPLTQWIPLTNGLVFTKDHLRFEQVISQDGPTGYYIAVEEAE